MGLYITPDPGVPAGCDPVRPTSRSSACGPGDPPPFHVPVPGARPHRPLGGGATIDVAWLAFTPANVAVRQGAVVRWRFWDDALHNVTLADGPAGFSPPTSATAAPTSSD